MSKPFNAELLRVRIGSCIEKQWFLSEEIQKRLTTFRKFVPQEFLQSLNKEDWLDVNLGDHVESDMTILFADIRSFTTISEKMSAEENFIFINEYLHHVYPPIQERHGFVDKFIGDAIMALFSNPQDAIDAGIAMHKALNAYNEERLKLNNFPINIGIGLHRGNLMLGMIGVEDRMQGTVISDAVNLASRIESLTKVFGSTLLVSNDVLSENKDLYSSRFLGKIVVAGKTDKVGIYEILPAEREEI